MKDLEMYNKAQIYKDAKISNSYVNKFKEMLYDEMSSTFHKSIYKYLQKIINEC